MPEYDAFQPYPDPKEPRIVGPHIRTIHNRIAASYRDREFYDGDRANGYGGMVDDGRWEPVARNLVDHYRLSPGQRVLYVNCHKGFLLRELYKFGLRVYGTETSDYAIAESSEKLTKAHPDYLPYPDQFFDLVLAPSVVYSASLPDGIAILKEIQRVSKGRAWITLAAMETENDIIGLMLLRHWFLLGTTILPKADWLEVMAHAGYTGDYRFDTAEHLKLKLAQ